MVFGKFFPSLDVELQHETLVEEIGVVYSGISGVGSDRFDGIYGFLVA